jgi:hypothetical protein
MKLCSCFSRKQSSSKITSTTPSPPEQVDLENSFTNKSSSSTFRSDSSSNSLAKRVLSFRRSRDPDPSFHSPFALIEGPSVFLTTPTDALPFDQNSKRFLLSEIYLWKDKVHKKEVSSLRLNSQRILIALVTSIEKAPVWNLEEKDFSKESAEAQNLATYNSESESDSREYIKAVFDTCLNILVIATYKSCPEKKTYSINFILKNPSFFNSPHAKGSAKACIRAIAREAFLEFGEEATIQSTAMDTSLHFFRRMGFTSSEIHLPQHLFLRNISLHHFLSETFDQMNFQCGPKRKEKEATAKEVQALVGREALLLEDHQAYGN